MMGFMGAFFWFPTSTHATLKGQKLFKETYSGQSPSYYKCSLCHTGGIGKKGELNTYGESLQLSLPEALTVEHLKAAESLDPDGDGASSGQEIQAGTHPGDSTSTP